VSDGREPPGTDGSPTVIHLILILTLSGARVGKRSSVL
jgi:hypothetical protein